MINSGQPARRYATFFILMVVIPVLAGPAGLFAQEEEERDDPDDVEKPTDSATDAGDLYGCYLGYSQEGQEDAQEDYFTGDEYQDTE